MPVARGRFGLGVIPPALGDARREPPPSKPRDWASDYFVRCGVHRAEIMNRATNTQRQAGAGNFLDQAPRDARALQIGVSVFAATWSGRNILGMVSDRDAAGLLLDLRGDETDALGYTFLPRFSVEQVDIPEVAHRQVEFPDS